MFTYEHAYDVNILRGARPSAMTTGSYKRGTREPAADVYASSYVLMYIYYLPNPMLTYMIKYIGISLII